MAENCDRARRESWHSKFIEVLRSKPLQWRQEAVTSVQNAATSQGVFIYKDSKRSESVTIQLSPWVLTQSQCRYLQFLSLRIRRAINKVLRNYPQDIALQGALPLTEDEIKWIRELSPEAFAQDSTLFERIDTNLIPDDPRWRSNMRIIEFNSVGVGCIHFMPITNLLIETQLLPVFSEVLPKDSFRPTTDVRMLLKKTIESHASSLKRKNLVVAFVERRETVAGGADEMQLVSDWMNEQGITSFIADPRDLEVKEDELVYKDRSIDVVYRDFSLSEIISIENHGGDVKAMKLAFKRNQVISSLEGEFDHKSLLEILSSPEFSRYFNPSQRRTFRKCVPWTRLIRERKTQNVEGDEVELPDYIRKNRQKLVIKPNRNYGGEDVIIGVSSEQADWEKALEKSISRPDSCVVQEVVELPELEFMDNESPKDFKKEYVTLGFIATQSGISFLGRSSPERVVNISKGGNLVPTFVLSSKR